MNWSYAAKDDGTSMTRQPVSLGELERAWDAVRAGWFRAPRNASSSAAVDHHEHENRDQAHQDLSASANPHAEPVGEGWSATEPLIAVLGAGGGVGATTTAIGLATAASASASARVVECCSAPHSGLVGASTAELGVTPTGWRRGLRDGANRPTLLERTTASHTTAATVPTPGSPDRPIAVSVVDCGWSLEHLADSWITHAITDAELVVIAATATQPGLRRLELTLEALEALGGYDVSGRLVGIAMLGPRRRRWRRLIETSMGPKARQLDAAGALIPMPPDRELGIRGPTSRPLPAALLASTKQLYALSNLPTALPTTKGTD